MPADKPFTSHSLRYQTTPDHSNLTFTTGLGIVFYEYRHHGTAGNCAMKLVETGTE